MTLIDPPCFGLHKERVASSQQQHKLYLRKTKNLQFGKSIEIKSTIIIEINSDNATEEITLVTLDKQESSLCCVIAHEVNIT